MIEGAVLIQQITSLLLATFMALSALFLGVLITIMCKYYLFK
jgi:hypothetical protein